MGSICLMFFLTFRNLLLSENFSNLRAAIFTDEHELKRFRSLVVNSVMATDIVDKELKNLRNSRWNDAFSVSTEDKLSLRSSPLELRNSLNRKATIVIEHLIQASDVSHT